MTNTVQKEEMPNPYNAKKTWHQGEDKPFKSADDGLFFEEPTDRNKLFDTNDITEVNAKEVLDKKIWKLKRILLTKNQITKKGMTI